MNIKHFIDQDTTRDISHGSGDFCDKGSGSPDWMGPGKGSGSPDWISSCKGSRSPDQRSRDKISGCPDVWVQVKDLEVKIIV